MSRALRLLKRRGELSPRAPHLERQFMWHALSLGAHLEARGAGVGRALLAEAELALRSLGCPKVNLQVLSTNAGALAFWNSVGYAPDDVVSLGRRAARRRPTKPPIDRPTKTQGASPSCSMTCAASSVSLSIS